MSVQSQIDRLELAKSNLRKEINKMGTIVPDNAKLDQYPSLLSKYMQTYESRLETLETRAQRTLYFPNSVKQSGTDVNARTSFLLEKSEYAIHLK